MRPAVQFTGNRKVNITPYFRLSQPCQFGLLCTLARRLNRSQGIEWYQYRDLQARLIVKNTSPHTSSLRPHFHERFRFRLRTEPSQSVDHGPPSLRLTSGSPLSGSTISHMPQRPWPHRSCSAAWRKYKRMLLPGPLSLPHTYLVWRDVIKQTSPLVYFPALHSAAAVGYESPSGASQAEFLMVYHMVMVHPFR